MNGVNDLLFLAWVRYFAARRFALQEYGSASDGSGNVTYNFESTAGSSFALQRSPAAYWNLESAKDITKNVVEAIVNDAIVKLVARDLGGDVIYQAVLKAAGKESILLMPNFGHLLRDQVLIGGDRRPGSGILLEFIPKMPEFIPKMLEDPAAQLLFLEAIIIKVTMFVPGPILSYFTQNNAEALLETVAAICAFALGKVVELPVGFLPG